MADNLGSVRIDVGLYYVAGTFTCDTLVIPADTIKNAAVAPDAAIARSKLAQNALVSFPIDITNLRVHDAPRDILPATSSGDDLGLYPGTLGTNSILARSADLKTAGATTLYARFQVEVPAEYDPGQDFQIRLKAGMITTIADTAATIDIVAYKIDGAGAVGGDLCATSAQSINSTTFANKDFAITSATLNPGDVLDVRVAVAVNDAASGTAVIAGIGKIERLCDIRG